jgi:guanyl-specific ribonuclease Sa
LAYDGYKAYKKYKKQGKRGAALWGRVAWAAGSNFLKVGKVAKVFRIKKGSRSRVKIPKKVYNLRKAIRKRKGKPLRGYVGGREYKNHDRKLPTNTTYKEYDINRYKKGKNRGRKRLVIGKNGKAYYTNDHYRTFRRL